MPRVDLVFQRECPNVAPARAQLRRALSASGLPVQWREWDSEDSRCPPSLRGMGSPTILVDDRDVCDPSPGGGDCCRVYVDSNGAISGVPPLDAIEAALRRSVVQGRRSIFATVPGVAISLLPILACPACWPVYLSAIGASTLGILFTSSVLIPVNAVALGVAIAVLARQAARHRRVGPVLLAAMASAAILFSKAAESTGVVGYLGSVALIAAVVWSARIDGPKRKESENHVQNA